MLAGLRFGLVYVYSEANQDTVYVLYDWRKSFNHRIAGTFFELDLALDVCSMLNYRDRADKQEEEYQ